MAVPAGGRRTDCGRREGAVTSQTTLLSHRIHETPPLLRPCTERHRVHHRPAVQVRLGPVQNLVRQWRHVALARQQDTQGGVQLNPLTAIIAHINSG